LRHVLQPLAVPRQLLHPKTSPLALLAFVGFTAAGGRFFVDVLFLGVQGHLLKH